MGEELDRIAALVLRELAKLGSRIQEHNAAFYAVACSSAQKGTRMLLAGADGDTVDVHHDYSGRKIELDGHTWTDMAYYGLGAGVLSSVEMAEAKARDAARVAAETAG